MEVNTANLEVQLNSIVNNSAPVPVNKPDKKTVQVEPSQTEIDLQAFEVAKSEGKELGFLTSQASALNTFMKELEVNVSYRIEALDVGGYVVSVVDGEGKVLKTIPGEQFIETRAKIRDELKGLIEDSQI